MKCVSCETEINPKWTHAIEINVCPFCGKQIMEEHLKNCLANLAVAMGDMQKYQEQLDDWLLSNHNYIKTDSPDLKAYLPKEAIKEMRKVLDDEEFQEKKKSVMRIKTLDEDGKVVEQDVVVEKMATDDRTQTFHDRANNMLKQEKAVDGDPKSVADKTKDLRAVAEKVKREVAAAMSNKEGGVASMMSKESMAEADPEAVAEFQSVIGSGDIVASGLPVSSMADGDDDEIPPAVLAMANMKKGNGPAGANEKDMRALVNMQAKAQGASKRLGSGKGSFSRG
jgi:hypothetical protein